MQNSVLHQIDVPSNKSSSGTFLLMKNHKLSRKFFKQEYVTTLRWFSVCVMRVMVWSTLNTIKSAFWVLLIYITGFAKNKMPVRALAVFLILLADIKLDEMHKIALEQASQFTRSWSILWIRNTTSMTSGWYIGPYTNHWTKCSTGLQEGCILCVNFLEDLFLSFLNENNLTTIFV